MVYIMNFYVDGGCRGNGDPYAVGASAACMMNRWGHVHRYRASTIEDSRYTPTSQRAELEAIIQALRWALETFQELDGCPELEVTINSDSKYAVGCMTEWCDKWANNGWLNSRGVKVVNRDLIKKALRLEDILCELGTVDYNWISRDGNVAHQYCDEVLDEEF